MNCSDTISRVTLQAVAGLPDFWPRVRRAPHRLLALDYDGTLAPFHVIRERATPLPGIKEALAAIRDHPETRTDLALLSGRPAWQVLELVGRDLHIPIYGAHGWECIRPDGSEERFSLSATEDEGLAAAIIIGVDAGYEEKLERKSASVALHTRGLMNALDIEDRIRRLWQPLTESHHLVLMTFDRGLELRARGRHKGVALAELYASMPPETLAVYVGDDTTDEDAFRVVKPHGLGIKVGLVGETEATGRLADPAAVLRFLQDWYQVTRAANN